MLQDTAFSMVLQGSCLFRTRLTSFILLTLPGTASLLVLPGDGMFHAQRIINGKYRPVILHSYGGAKKEMPTSLAALAQFGWVPMAAAMVGSGSSSPLWTGQDWRPILGTSVDTRILPPPLSEKESLLLLSQWIRLPRDDLHIRHATYSWLSPVKVNVALGPDCDFSPHPIRELPLDLGTVPYIDMLFGLQKADQRHASKMAKHEESQTPGKVPPEDKALPAPEKVLVTCRLQVDSCRPAELSALIRILLGGTPVSYRNRQLWTQAVQDHFDDVPLSVPFLKLLQLVWETASGVFSSCTSSWCYTTWLLTVQQNGTSSWTNAYLSAHGYVLVLGGHSPYTCMDCWYEIADHA